MNSIINELLYTLITVVITVAGTFAIRYVNAKTDSAYKDEIASAVTTAVTYVQQVYVDRAKAVGTFSEKENQNEALNMAVAAVNDILSPAATSYLHKNRTDAESDNYLKTLIEEAVRIQKKKEGL